MEAHPMAFGIPFVMGVAVGTILRPMITVILITIVIITCFRPEIISPEYSQNVWLIIQEQVNRIFTIVNQGSNG
jgi:hypothetical protein